MKYILKKVEKPINLDNFNTMFYSPNIDSCWMIKIIDKMYLINYDYDVIEFSENNSLFLNLSNNVAIISLKTGNIKYYSGLQETFVGVELLEYDFLIVTDTSFFLINKEYYYPWGYKSISDNILDYNLSKENYEITLNLAVDGELVEKLNCR